MPRQWVCLDIDGWNIPSSYSPSQPEEIIKWAIQQLPSAFQGCMCHYQFSSSYGITNDTSVLKVHLWFWFNRKVSNQELVQLFEKSNPKKSNFAIDTSLFNPAQPCFTAEPILAFGITFPLSKRSGLLIEARPIVDFPHCERPIEKKVINVPLVTKEKLPVISGNQPIYEAFDDYLNDIGDDKNGFHDPIRAAISFLAMTQGRNANWNDAKEEIRTTSRNANKTKHSKSEIERYLSDEYLDDDWNRCLKKFDNNPNKKYRLIQGIKTKRPLAELSLEEAQDMIGFTVSSWWRNGAKQPLLINATPGTGKSTIILSFLEFLCQKNYIRSFWYLCPTVELAEELSNRFNGPKQVIRGRNQINPENGSMCHKSQYVKAIQKKFGSVYQHLCYNTHTKTRCEHYADCPYLTQFNTAKHAQGIFMSHQYALLSQRKDNRLVNPDIVIIDESILQTLIKTTSLPAVRFKKDADEYLALAELIIGELEQNRSPIPAMIEKGFKKELVREIIKKLSRKRVKPVNPSDTEESIKNALSRKKRNTAVLVLDAILKEWECQPERQELYSVMIKQDVVIPQKRKKSPYQGSVLYVQTRADLKIPASAKVLLLDGYADEKLLKPAFPNLESHSFNVRQNAFIVQTHGYRASMESLLSSPQKGKYQNEINGLIKRIGTSIKSGLVVSYKGLEANINIPEDWFKNHFNAIRGINAYEDCEACIVIGRTQPGLFDVERQVRGLFYDQPEKINFISNTASNYPATLRGFYLANNEEPGISVPFHPDERCDALLQQIRENEILQAIGRIRAVRSESIKWIVLINELPLPIPVNALVHYRSIIDPSPVLDSIIELGGILPGNPEFLMKKFPDRWKEKKATSKLIERTFKKLVPYGTDVIGLNRSSPCLRYQATWSILHASMLHFHDRYLYRTLRQRRPSVCYSFLNEAETKQRLEKEIGELVEFRIDKSKIINGVHSADPIEEDAA